MTPMVDLKAQYRSIKREVDTAIQSVLEDTHFVMGASVTELEERVAEYCQCRFGVAVGSGTDALRLSLAALGIGSGDEVITTPFTFVATANTISRSGAQPVFVDIDPLTYNLDPEAVAAAITPRTKAIVPVHLYGQPAEMESILAVAKTHGLFVIEDCAQAIGARYRGERVGSLGDVGCLSFFPSKNLGAYGDGGMVVTRDPSLAGAIDVLRRHGGSRKYHHEVVGFNSRLDTLQAAVLNVKLNYLEGWNESRRRIANRYNELLSGLPITTPFEAPECTHVYHQYTIRTSLRDQLAEYLKSNNVATMIYYPVPLHRQSLYRELATPTLPNAEKSSAEVLSLPMYPELNSEDQDRIVELIRDFFNDSRRTNTPICQRDLAYS